MPNEVPFIPGLRGIASLYDAFIVDLWGVIYDDHRLCQGAFNALSQLSDLRKQVIFLSNTPSRIAASAKKLERMGVKGYQYRGILTAGEMIYHELRTRIDPFFGNIRRRCFHLGPEVYWNAFADLGYTAVPNIDEADFLLVTGTFGKEDTLGKYDPFFKQCLSRRLPMVCANPDTYFIKDGSVVLAPGAIAAQYQSIGGSVFWRGKPEKAVFDYCVEGFDGVDRSRIAVVGDSVSTDIKGANAAGLDALFIAGGSHAGELGITRGQQPDADKVASLFKRNGVTAAAVLPAFVW